MKNGRYEEEDGIVYYYKDGFLHREDGPAIEYCSEWPELNLWFLNGLHLTEQEFNHWLTKKQLNEKLQSTLAPSHKAQRGKI